MTVIDVPMAELPPTPNRMRTMHWATRSRATKDAREGAKLSAWVKQRGRRETEPQECRIEILYPTWRSGPMTDPDSALARLKPLIDGLVDAGCLRGDGPADVVYAPVEQRKEGARLIVRFTLTPVAGPGGESTTE